MKNLVCIFMFIFSSISYGQNKYNVFVDSANANKETIANVENHLTMFNKSIDGTKIVFESPVNYSNNYIDSVFNIYGVEVLVTVRFKSEMVSLEKAGGNNCELAELLCSGASVSGTSGGPGTVQELNGANSGCLGIEHQSSWYYVNIQTGGTLSFTIDPNGADDYDFAVWGPFTPITANSNCPPTTDPIRCSYAATNGNTGLNNNNTTGQTSEGAAGNGIVSGIAVSPNQIYILLVDNFTSSNSGYNLSFDGTATLGCIPVILPVELTYFEGDKLSNTNVLTWETESENNNDYFLVEWTSNPTSNSWNNIGIVNGAGNSTNQNTYYLSHDSYTRNEINYYRLTQVDFDGQTKVYDELVAINNTIKTKEIIRIINLLGQEVDINTSGIVIIQYIDGSILRHFNK